jgi:hypothetical protein
VSTISGPGIMVEGEDVPLLVAGVVGLLDAFMEHAELVHPRPNATRKERLMNAISSAVQVMLCEFGPMDEGEAESAAMVVGAALGAVMRDSTVEMAEGIAAAFPGFLRGMAMAYSTPIESMRSNPQ